MKIKFYTKTKQLIVYARKSEEYTLECCRREAEKEGKG
jgi:hypothetical protein